MEKKCIVCSTTYEASGPAGKYCKACSAQQKVMQNAKKRLYAEKKRRERGVKVGAGAPPGNKHPGYKHGMYVAQTQSRKYKAKMGHTCERCEKDLEFVSQWEWAMHHKDHNHANHDIQNLELLCKRCHLLEHKCWNNLKVQRPSRKGVGPSGPKRQTPPEGDDMVCSHE